MTRNEGGICQISAKLKIPPLRCIILFLIGLFVAGGSLFPTALLAEEKKKSVTFNLAADELLPFVEKLILLGKLLEAGQMLDQIRGKTPDAQQEKFLLGQIAILEKRYKDGIRIYRDMLNIDPGLTRVRLELAQAHFLNKDDGNARHQFELVRAGALPWAVQQKVDIYLFELRKRKKWQVTTYFAVVPDSNISGGPDQETVTIIGLPSTLSDDARETSGVGIMGAVGYDYFWRLGEKIRLKSGLRLNHTQYGKTQFNDTFLSGNLGPHFVFEKTALTFQATGYYRWFGGERYNYGVGGQILIEHIFSPRWRLNGRFSWQELRYIENKRRNGRLYGGTVRFSYGLNSSSFASFLFGLTREETRDKSLANINWRGGLGYYKDFGKGVTLNIRPEILIRNYEEMDFFFGEIRRDRRLSTQFELVKRDWSFWGLAPLISYSYTHNASNIDLFSYNRHRVQLGVTGIF